MAKLGCPCGNSLSNVCFPNTLEGEIKGIYEYVSRNVWECAECGRLAIDMEDEQGVTICKWYNPEDGTPGELFAIGSEKEFVEHLRMFWIFHEEDLKKLGIIQDKEPMLNACIQDYQKKLDEARERIDELEEHIRGI